MNDFGFRLPEYIRPIKYRIRIKPTYPTYNSFGGTCSIIYECDNESKSIIMHTKDLKISEVYLVDAEDWYELVGIQHHKHYQQTKFIFDSNIPKLGMLVIKYVGKIYKEPVGICKASLSSGWIMYTHFEPISARKCFPCFDEPGFKAKFNLEIIAHNDKIVLSNTNAKQIYPKKGDNTVHIFNETPIMSTYLVAFYIGQSEFLERKTTNGVLARVFIDSCEDLREDALDLLVKSMDWMTNITGIQYPLPKIDIVFIPYLDGGAMENWGLIVHKHECCLEPKKKYEMSNKEYILFMVTICHEVAHQWFGNLVTPKWWSDILLKESFSTMLGWMMANDFKPNLEIAEYFYISEITSALKLDAMHNSHPVLASINDTDDFTKLFDPISYAKGSMVLNMISIYLGNDIFFSAVKQFLQKYQYQTATVEDLVVCFENISGKAVSTMFSNWITQKNYPIVTITLSGENVTLEQEPFTTIPNHSNKKWMIPLSEPINGADTPIVLDKKRIIVQKDKIPYKLNKNASGFYLVRYEDGIMRNILLNNFDNLSNLDLLNINFDLYMLLKSNRIRFGSYLEYLKIILSKLDPLSVSVPLLKQIHSYFIKFKKTIRGEDKDYTKKYAKLVENYMASIIQKQDLINSLNPNESNDIRIVSMDTMLSTENPDVIMYLNNIFDKFMEKYEETNKIDFYDDEAILFMSFESAIKHKPVNERNVAFDFLLKLLYDNKYKQELLNTLPMTPDLANYKKILELIFWDSFSFDNKIDLLENASDNNKFNRYYWKFYRDNWDEIYKIFDNRQISMPCLFEPLSNLVDEDGTLIDEITEFFGKKNMKSIGPLVDKSLEVLKINTYFNRLIVD